MQIGETLGVALEALRANKLRSFLTMLGIVIGVAAVIAMVALGRGAQQSVKDRIASLGTTLLNVVPSQARGAGGIASASDRAPLTFDDIDALQTRANYVLAVLGVIFGWGRLHNLAPASNPAHGVPKIPRPRELPRANRPWTDAD